jgi:phage I-like protein
MNQNSLPKMALAPQSPVSRLGKALSGLLNGFKRLVVAGLTPLLRAGLIVRAFFRRDHRLFLANHAPTGVMWAILANDFKVLQDDWVQIVPYGDFLHGTPMGADGKPYKENGRVKYPNGVIQRVDNEAGQALVQQFESLKGKAAQTFGGLPWYRGHHDLDPIRYPDPNSYGWIMELRNQSDGVYGKVKWTPDGEKLKTDGSFKFYSPAFDGLDDTGKLENGRAIVRPALLRSVAFTNNPNMAVLPLANEAARLQNDGLADQLLDKAGLMNEAERVRWHSWFAEDFAAAALALGNAGTREGALKGWETRRAGMAAKDPAKTAAKVASKTRKSGSKKAARLKLDPAKIAAAKIETSDSLAAQAASVAKTSPGASKTLSARSAELHADAASPKPTPPPLPQRQTEIKAAAAATGKPKSFLGHLFDAFKNPHVHDGGAV